MEIVFTGIVCAILMMFFFFLGVYVANRMAQDAKAEADYQYRKMMAYRLAGVERPGDPLPYVAPPMKGNREIPCLDEIERRLKSGERGTVKVN